MIPAFSAQGRRAYLSPSPSPPLNSWSSVISKAIYKYLDFREQTWNFKEKKKSLSASSTSPGYVSEKLLKNPFVRAINISLDWVCSRRNENDNFISTFLFLFSSLDFPPGRNENRETRRGFRGRTRGKGGGRGVIKTTEEKFIGKLLKERNEIFGPVSFYAR